MSRISVTFKRDWGIFIIGTPQRKRKSLITRKIYFYKLYKADENVGSYLNSASQARESVRAEESCACARCRIRIKVRSSTNSELTVRFCACLDSALTSALRTPFLIRRIRMPPCCALANTSNVLAIIMVEENRWDNAHNGNSEESANQSNFGAKFGPTAH